MGSIWLNWKGPRARMARGRKEKGQGGLLPRTSSGLLFRAVLFCGRGKTLVD